MSHSNNARLEILEKLLKSNFHCNPYPALKGNDDCRIRSVDHKDMKAISALCCFIYVSTSVMKITWPEVADFIRIDIETLSEALFEHDKIIKGTESKRYRGKIRLLINGLKMKNEKV